MTQPETDAANVHALQRFSKDNWLGDKNFRVMALFHKRDKEFVRNRFIQSVMKSVE